MKWGFALLFMLCGASYLEGATAASCSRADVETAYNATSDGETLSIPAGAPCTWTAYLLLAKAITVSGAGVGQTIIRNGSSDGIFLIGCPQHQAMRITGIEFNNNGGHSFGSDGSLTAYCYFDISNPDTTLRIDHCKFDHLPAFAIVTHNVVGVFDHNTFLLTSYSDDPLMIYNDGTDRGGGKDNGDDSWFDAVTWGSAANLYLEDNTWVSDTDPSACNDGLRGTRYVARFNTVTGCAFQNHGTESGGRFRGGRSAEIYANNISGSIPNIDFGLRSGSVLAWGNRLPSGSTISANLGNDRSVYTFFFGSATGANQWDLNDAGNPFASATATGGNGSTTAVVSGAGWTTNQWFGYMIVKTSGGGCGFFDPCASPIVSNTSDTITYVIGQSFGNEALLSFSNGETFNINKVTEALDQAGRGGGSLISGANPTPPWTAGQNDQVDFPVYSWLNTAVGGANNIAGVNPTCYASCRENEHYYNYGGTVQTSSSSPFSGSPSTNNGVGVGTIARRPGTCTTGVFYWATDEGSWNDGSNLFYTGQGKGYKCTATNTWTAYYTPLNYPHPLVVPSDVRIVSVTPSAGTQGQSLTVDVVGAGTSWVNGKTAASVSGSGVVINSTTVSDPTHTSVSLTILPGTVVGARDFIMTTGP